MSPEMEEAIKECYLWNREFIELDTLRAAILRANYYWDEFCREVEECLLDLEK